MSKHGDGPITSGQVKALGAALLEGIPSDMPAAIAQEWIRRKGELGKELRKMLLPTPDIEALLQDQQGFLNETFGLDLDLTDLEVPERVSGFDRLIVVPKGMTPNKAYEVCKAHFPCWRWTDDLDAEVTKNDREPQETYAVWTRDRAKADEELKGLSANALGERGVQGQTLTERLLHGLKVFKETGEHLDLETVTLCAGSRYSGGHVPDVCWDRVRLGVSCYLPGARDGRFRSRQVVS